MSEIVDLTLDENVFGDSFIEINDNLSENSDFDDEPEDSCLKILYNGQSFTSFELLEQCLNRYSTQLGFETKIVRAEKEEEGLILMNEMQESSIRIIQNEEELLSTETFQALENICGRNVYASPVKDSKKAFYGYGLGLCKKAINLAIINNSDDIEQDTNQEINTFMISNPLQHKGKGHSSNKRYLSAIENNTMKYSKSNHHDEPAEGSKKRNKR
ncbi:hypothetical protein GLOIN_2v1844064 [Rhizophagus irregularis DAOM 181602=DAOM 197198]|uniref:Uncharacterized protein n=1 Tax=Rhizophagus irregularis (strain DAOM 181602 / DAOM 197198 / MUCL 43194) TaxID=747089 RepID=U9UK18_RHIID|nr:hypothetical protein GLOIN_2v1844064 [Rhizophagus irregularis DAOM 181602=DAOM 197198]